MTRSVNKAVVKTVRLTQEQSERVATYAAAAGMRGSEALRQLIEAGLTNGAMSLFSTPLGQYVAELMGAQLELFRVELERRNDDLEDRLSRLCSKGTKASLQTALMQLDTMQGLFAAMSELDSSQVWQAYQDQAGQLQAGKSLRKIKAEIAHAAQ